MTKPKRLKNIPPRASRAFFPKLVELGEDADGEEGQHEENAAEDFASP